MTGDFVVLALQLAADAPATVESAFIRTLVAAGPVGVFLVAILFKKGVMTTSEHHTAKESWERQEARYCKDIDELKAALKEANEVYVSQVIPTLTRVLDAERELVDLRRDEQAERRRRGTASPG